MPQQTARPTLPCEESRFRHPAQPVAVSHIQKRHGKAPMLSGSGETARPPFACQLCDMHAWADGKKDQDTYDLDHKRSEYS